MGRRQKGKGHKRRKSWHRGRGEAIRSARIMRRLPDVGSGADPSTGEPAPRSSSLGPRRKHGDAV